MRILFIDPPGQTKPVKDSTGASFNLAIATLAPILVKHGHQVSLFDMMNHYENRSIEFVKPSLNRFRPDIICFSILNAQYLEAVEAIKRLRAITSLPIIVGGAEPSAVKEKIFYDTEFSVNISVLGEGEETLPKIINYYKNGKRSRLEEIAGIIINKDGKLTNTGAPQVIKDLDKYPYPDLQVTGVKRFDEYRVLGSRGCPFNCSFCFSYLGNTWRGRNPERIISELLEAKKKYNYKYFRFFDPVFNLQDKWVLKICDAIKRSDLSGMPWEVVGARADRLSDSLCKKMVDAGCVKVIIGVESLHPEVFKHIKKGETIEQIKKGVKNAVKYFQNVAVFLIIGLPEDTRERCLFSYREVKKLNPSSISFAIAVPYTGTRLEQWVNEHAAVLGTSHDCCTRGSTAYKLGVSYETENFRKEERLEVFNMLTTREFIYVSESKLPRYLAPLSWMGSAIKYDTHNFQKHIFRIAKYYIKRVPKKLQALIYENNKSCGHEYEKIPDGTWWIG